MRFENYFMGALSCAILGASGLAAPAPTIDPIPTVTIPAGKSLILPVTATSPTGLALAYTAASSTGDVAVVVHTNNPFWQVTVAQRAATSASGAYQTPFRGGLATVTNVGAMTFMLFPEYAPHTLNVFQGLTTSGFYTSNTIFHRVVANFVIQGGDPMTNGLGGLVFQYDDEFNPQAIFSGNGQLALANSGKNTDGSQFFVTVGPQRFLDFGYTLFGQLVRGFNVLTNIERTAVDTNSRPLADEIIQQAAYVVDTTDTVLTLTATNVSGITAKITIIADDGAGGRATNTFDAKTVADTNSNNNPIIYPNNSVTNLVAPVNTSLTNVLAATELDGDALYWYPEYANQQSVSAITNFSSTQTNNILMTLTYNVTNKDGQLRFVVTPVNNYTGPASLLFNVSYSSQWSLYEQLGLSPPAYDSQTYTFVFGDTPISGQGSAVTLPASFADALLASFTNGVADSPAANFTASINWGDDIITAGDIAFNGSGQKVVLGSHTYAYPGTYPVYVTVQSAIGASATILSYVTAIASAPVLSVSATPALGTNGFSFNVQAPSGLNGSVQVSTDLTIWTTLANFTGTNSTLTFADPAATNSGARFYRAVVR